MPISLNVTIRLRLQNKPGTLARVLTTIAESGGSLGSIDLLSASQDHVIRELMVRVPDKQSLKNIAARLDSLAGVDVIYIADRILLKHLGGKLEVTAKRNIETREDLSLVYTPGVAKVAQSIYQNPDLAYRFTIKGNSVAIVTDGSAVLGLGNLGPTAALPVMEGKSLLFKRFGNIDAFPICLNTQDPEQIINTVVALSPVFGGINLEDIAAPRCFIIEEALREKLDIPVFHDDQHGTAIVTLAGLLNALKVVGKKLSECKIVISGAGAAGMAITRILLKAGADNIVVCDRQGAISSRRTYHDRYKSWLAENTNPQEISGNLAEAIKDADIFIGVSGPGLLIREDILNMNEKPVVFALANPEPEIAPEEIFDIAGVVATGRSDYPNQINNVLAFPGIFRGALDCYARCINDDMNLAAAEALANIITPEQLNAENIIPSVFSPKVVKVVAQAVARAAKSTGVARKHTGDIDNYNLI
ncbi:MAG: NAD-dependent malic enzyme [Desulfurispora sp.]|uniref:NAD-dependent malic enzyme n=1 Tax=Desulfurispora sp. TaxID=3014275 RepID=UPI0040496438